MTLVSSWGAVTESKKTPSGEQFIVDGGTLSVEFWSDNIVRVTYVAATELPALKSLSVIRTPVPVHFKRKETDLMFMLIAPHLKVKINKQTGAVSFLDLSDQVLLQESAQGRKIEPATQHGASGDSCAQAFELPPDEGLYGLGQHQKGVWNYHNGGPEPP